MHWIGLSGNKNKKESPLKIINTLNINMLFSHYLKMHLNRDDIFLRLSASTHFCLIMYISQKKLFILHQCCFSLFKKFHWKKKTQSNFKIFFVHTSTCSEILTKCSDLNFAYFLISYKLHTRDVMLQGLPQKEYPISIFF